VGGGGGDGTVRVSVVVVHTIAYDKRKGIVREEQLSDSDCLNPNQTINAIRARHATTHKPTWGGQEQE
jgi:uncharacterized protein (DUF433 family)